MWSLEKYINPGILVDFLGDEDTLVALANRLFEANRKIRQLIGVSNNSNTLFAHEKQSSGDSDLGLDAIGFPSWYKN